MIIVSWFWMLADDLRNLYSSESSRLGMPIRWVAYVPIPCASVHGGHCHLSLSFFVLCRTHLKILLSMFDRQLLSSIAWTSSSPESYEFNVKDVTSRKLYLLKNVIHYQVFVKEHSVCNFCPSIKYLCIYQGVLMNVTEEASLIVKSTLFRAVLRVIGSMRLLASFLPVSLAPEQRVARIVGCSSVVQDTCSAAAFSFFWGFCSRHLLFPLSWD